MEMIVCKCDPVVVLTRVVIMLISEKIKIHCKSAGIISYQKRLLVARTLEELDCAVTADEVWSRVRSGGNKVSFPAVYGILNWLIRNGFVEKQAHSERSMLYTIRKY